MKLRFTERVRRAPRGERPLLADFLRTCAGIILGILSTLLVSLAFQRFDEGFLLGALIVGPAVWLVLLVNYGAAIRWRSLARSIGALAGWLAFLLVFTIPEFNQWLLSFHILPFVLLATTLAAAALVAVGVVAGDFLWSRFHIG